MTRPFSLGLLPSGPDPVGEWNVHHQPPALYIGDASSKNKPKTSDPGLKRGLGFGPPHKNR
jgi:hypothetical protein